MAAIDACEPQVLRALEKDGWSILSKPFAIRTSQHTVYADCILERKINGQNEQAIILEVKCFTDARADLQEFYTALGQYQFYRAAVTANQSTTAIYLAIPFEAYRRLSKDNAVAIALQRGTMQLVDIEAEEVVQWIR